jgi:hypothetical protein
MIVCTECTLCAPPWRCPAAGLLRSARMFDSGGGGGRATEVPLGPVEGLRVESVANLDSVQLVARSRLVRRVGRARASTMSSSAARWPSRWAASPDRGATPVVEAPGIEPGSEAASRETSTSVVPVLISPEQRPGTRLYSGQPRWMSRPAPWRHRAARPLVLTSGPDPEAEGPVDVRPRPERLPYSGLGSESVGGSAVRTYIFPGFTSPGLGSPSHNPRPRRNHTPPSPGCQAGGHATV